MTKKEIKKEEKKEIEAPVILNFNKKIVEQIEKEYVYCEKVLRPKIKEWLARLRVYNNQRRKKEAIGDPLLFTIFQTLFASLYEDRLNVSFEPRERGDIEVADNLNVLADFDYDEMEKDILDYEWIWDTMFFGRGLVLNMEFDRKRKCPTPETISPLLLLRDPVATSVNGNKRGKGAARFLGWESLMTKWQMEKIPAFFNLGRLERGEDQETLTKKAERERREAQGLEQVWSEEKSLEDNAYFNILNWFTFIGGKRCLVSLTDNRKTLVRFEEVKGDQWPVVDRALFPISNDWDGVSVPDLTEDKQRARAILINLGLEVAKANVNPMYLFDINRIKRRDYLDFQFNKFIPVDGSPANAVQPMIKDRIQTEVQWILQMMDESSQRALATPEIQQGIISKRTRTLGELELVSAKVDTRYSLAAKIFGWSERRFWEGWYSLYKRHFKEKIDEKVARIVGLWGPEFRELKRENIVAKVDPDIKVESEIVSKSRKILERQMFGQFVALASQSPDLNVRFALKELGQLNNLKRDKLRQLFPPTYDELKAEEENKEIEDGNVPRVLVTDDHMEHLAVHARVNESEEKEKHIKVHYEAMRIQKMNIKAYEEAGLVKRTEGEPIRAEIKEEIPEMGEMPEEPAGRPARRSPTIVPAAFTE